MDGWTWVGGWITVGERTHGTRQLAYLHVFTTPANIPVSAVLRPVAQLRGGLPAVLCATGRVGHIDHPEIQLAPAAPCACDDNSVFVQKRWYVH
jgi:hypothetical protein